MTGSNIGRNIPLPETGKGYNSVHFQVWRKLKAKYGEKCCMLYLCGSQSAYLHIYICMTAASPALHVVDMANIEQMLLIPQSTLRLPCQPYICSCELSICGLLYCCVFLHGSVCVWVH